MRGLSRLGPCDNEPRLGSALGVDVGLLGEGSG
jgi:hypothetical protein